MLPDMIQGFLSTEETPDIWLTCERDEIAIGFCYAMPETLTDGTWNMVAIAVLPELQGSGAGATLVKAVEDKLREEGHRIIIVDTSGTEAYAKTRNFYLKIGYTQEARLRDFWAEGDDKIVFWKSLKA
ncbi:MAG: GNAT family N-acetyltransferase [Alphaproteobacteria bacterium PA3]|nr:MAG: GNAT family N-acetyltransferase [Alphaproteobacteria bacterium PA3]